MHEDIIVKVSVVSTNACSIRETKLSVDSEKPVDSAKKYENGIKMKHRFENMKV